MQYLLMVVISSAMKYCLINTMNSPLKKDPGNKADIAEFLSHLLIDKASEQQCVITSGSFRGGKIGPLQQV